MRIIKFLTPFIFLIFGLSLHGQNLENIGSNDPISLSGNISVGASFYSADGRENRRSPFAYYISANPTISLYGFDIPVSFTYRDQQGSISDPFNRFSISPTYKWITLHLGATSLQMSPYTLSGQLINGAGVSLKPGKFRVSAVYGTLRNTLAQVDSLVQGAQFYETYKREAMAAKVGYASKVFSLGLIGFRAKDDPNSVNVDLLTQRFVKPEENVVLGAELKITPIKSLSIYANIAGSAHTANQNTPLEFDPELQQDLKAYEDIIKLNFSSKIQFAGDGGIDYKVKNFGIGLNYKRVDPLYKSLGTFYFLEDYENYTLKLNFSAAKGKIRFTGRGGLQRNNLNDLRSVSSLRRIASLNVTVAPSRAFSLTGRYSNFQTERAPGVVSINDSLRLARTTAVYGIIPRITFGSKESPNTLILSATYQNLEDLLNDEDTGRGIDNYTGNATLSKQWRPLAMGAGISFLFNQNTIQDRETRRLGGNIRWNKRFFDKQFNVTTTVGFFQNSVNGNSDGESITASLGLAYRVKQQYNISLRANYLNRSSNTLSDFSEVRGAVKFTYIFATKKAQR